MGKEMLHHSIIVEYIKYKDYSRAAKEMRTEAIKAKERNRKPGQIASVITIERTLKSIHSKLRPLRELSRTPTEVAEETYEQTREILGLDKFDDVIELGGL
jgi:hypothetical protein